MRDTETAPRRRLLILFPFAPQVDATHGGGRAAGQLLAHLAARHDVAVIYLRDERDPRIDAALAERCALVEEVVRPRRRETGVAQLGYRTRLWAGFVTGTPVLAVDAAVPEVARRVHRVARSWRPDIVQAEYTIMAQHLSALDGCSVPRLLTVYEPGSDAAVSPSPDAHRLARFRRALDARSWRRFERRALRSVDAVVAFTERDRKLLQSLAPRARVTRISIGTTPPNQPLDPRGASEDTLVFVGSYRHPPNIDAAVRLARSIFPRVRARFPDATLQIVGEQPPEELCALADDQVLVTGRVVDVTPYLDRAALVVVPLRLGGGMRVKVMEALAAGKAVVASPLAVEGLDLHDGEQLLIASDDDGFVEAIDGLLRDPDRRVTLARNARSWAIEHLGWSTAVAGYERLYAQLLGEADQECER